MGSTSFGIGQSSAAMVAWRARGSPPRHRRPRSRRSRKDNRNQKHPYEHEANGVLRGGGRMPWAVRPGPGTRATARRSQRHDDSAGACPAGARSAAVGMLARHNPAPGIKTWHERLISRSARRQRARKARRGQSQPAPNPGTAGPEEPEAPPEAQEPPAVFSAEQ